MDTNDDPDDRWNGVLDELLDHVDVLLPNEQEACRITKRDTIEDALRVLSARVPCIAAKCGPRGALVQVGEKQSRIPPLTVNPVDTIGAGDSFNAGFLCAYLQGADPTECAVAGNITGALSTLRAGGTEAFRDPQFRDTFLREHHFPLPTR